MVWREDYVGEMNLHGIYVHSDMCLEVLFKPVVFALNRDKGEICLQNKNAVYT